MSIRNKILLGLLAVFIIIQFFQPARNQSSETLPTDLAKTVNVPDTIQNLIKAACYDCHSNNTGYPWYSRIQPFGWFLANHVRKGKAELNLSDFGSYSSRRRTSKMNGIAGSIRDGSMPLSSYTLMHKKARLSSSKKALLIEWATKTKDSLRTIK